MISIEKRISDLKELLAETEAIDPPVDKALLLVLKQLMRRNEIELILRDYFIKRCFFGYLLLQSQVIEEQLRNIIHSAELVLKSEGKNSLLSVKINLESLPLGSLLNEIKKYINYQPLLDNLNDFNKDRRKIVHHLIDDYSSDINLLEKEVVNKYSPNEVSDMVMHILEVSRRISGRMLSTTLKNIPEPNKAFAEKTFNLLTEGLNLQNENIILLF